MLVEVVMLIDLENLRYGLLNNHGQEPDYGALVNKAMSYGRPSVMKAYADFKEHPESLPRQLEVAGIDCMNVPVKRTTYAKGGTSIERVKNAADMFLALDAINEALEAQANQRSKVFLLVSGDRDYVKLVTTLRYKFGQRVVIAGVPGTVSGELINASGSPPDNVEVPRTVPADMVTIKRKIVGMVRNRPTSLKYWSLKLIDQWALDARQAIPGTAKERRDAITELINEGVIVRRQSTDAARGSVTEAVLNEDKARELGLI